MRFPLKRFVGAMLLVFWGISSGAAQQVSKIAFVNSGNLTYAKSINTVFAYGHLPEQNFLDNAWYSIKVENPILKRVPNAEGLGNILASPDGSLLYKTFPDSVHVYELPAMNLAYSFASNGAYWFLSVISAQDPHLLVTRNAEGMVLFKNGVQLPNTSPASSIMAFSETLPIVYTMNNSTTDNELRAIVFDSEGFIENTTDYHFHNGDTELRVYKDKIYCTEGSVIDISAEIPKYAGQHTVRLNDLVSSSGVGAIQYKGTLIDEGQQQFIQIRWLTGDKFQLLHFDIEDLTLQEISEVEMPFLPFENTIIQMTDGPNFAYSTSEEIVLVKNCTDSPLPAPILDPIYQEEMPLCYELNTVDPITVLPPAGYTAFMDNNGFVHDTFTIEFAGAVTVQVLDENGCASLPSAPFSIKNSYKPNKPIITVLEDSWYNILSEANLCEEGQVYLRGEAQMAENSFFLWSTGERGDDIAVNTTEPISVQVVNEDGCYSDTSELLTINPVAFPTPEAPTIVGDNPNGNTNICFASFVSLKGEDGFDAYYWRHIGEFEFGQNLQVLANEPDLVTLQVRSAEGCWSDKSTTQIDFTLDPIPEQPVIQEFNGQLAVDKSAQQFRWYFDGEIIPDSNVPILDNLETGNYRVSLGNGKCWGPQSLPFFVQ